MKSPPVMPPPSFFLPTFVRGRPHHSLPDARLTPSAGMSAESGFSTFRDSGGLWEQYPVEKVATPEGWEADPAMVTEFYNRLRRQLVTAQPNEGHRLIAELETRYDVTVVTQNVDNLHERAGSHHVIHLHGELMKACSSRHPDDARSIVSLPPERPDIEPGTKAADGSLLRPHRVFWRARAAHDRGLPCS